MDGRFDAEAVALVLTLSPDPRLVVVGGASFWGPDSLELCESVAVEIAALAHLVVLTGGMEGVGLTFGRAFAQARRVLGLPEHLIHLLPHGFGPCSIGETLGAGVDYRERREVLGRVGHAYLVVEGGPGTVHEVTVAAGRGVPVIPLGRTGGHAGESYSKMNRPPWASSSDWALLGDATASIADVTSAVGRLVRTALGC